MASTVALHDDLERRNHAVDVIDSVRDRLESAGSGRVMCSRDPEVVAVAPEMVDLIAADFSGVKRFFLPVAAPMPSDGVGRFAAYTSVLNPGARVSQAVLGGTNYALKVVLSGSITYGDQVLTAADWLWIPAGASYSFAAREMGAVMFTALACVDETPCGDGGGVDWAQRVEAFRRVDTVDGLLKMAAGGDFISSRDPGVNEAVAGLSLDSFAEAGNGVSHLALPFAPRMPRILAADGRFFAWLSALQPHVLIPRHSHELEKLADYKVVISGSIYCKDRELTAGDWLWAPAGGSYSFSVGDKGALLLSGWPHN